MSFCVVLARPQIAANTGNIIRLAANMGAALRLAAPLGFAMDNKRLRRAGLDYHDLANVFLHACAADAVAAAQAAGGGRVFALAAGGQTRYDRPAFAANDIFLFGCESVGLNNAELALAPPARRLFLPMRAGNRSINLANAVAMTLMEAWRQNNFAGAAARRAAQWSETADSQKSFLLNKKEESAAAP